MRMWGWARIRRGALCALLGIGYYVSAGMAAPGALVETPPAVSAETLPRYQEFIGEVVSDDEMTAEVVERLQYGAERQIAKNAAAVLAGLPEFSGAGYSPAQLEAAAFMSLQLQETENRTLNPKNTPTMAVRLRTRGWIYPVKVKAALDSRDLLDMTVNEIQANDSLNGQMVAALQTLKRKNPVAEREKLSRQLRQQEKEFQRNYWTLKGSRAILNAEYAQAEELYTRSLEAGSDNSGILAMRGKARYYQGGYDRAILDYSAALARDGRNALLYYYRGNAYYFLGQWEEALADYTAVLALEPGNAAAWYNRGNVYRKKEMKEQAIADYTAALAINPNLTNAYANRGDIRSQLQQWDAALADYQEALKLEPGDPALLYSRGNLYSQQGNYDAAIADYSAVLAIDSRMAVAYQNRGTAYLKKNILVPAAADFEQALALEPHYALAYYNKAVTLEKMTFAADAPPLDTVLRMRQIIDAYRNFLQYAAPNHPAAERARERIKLLESQTTVLDI
ncbi:MAG TPA: tetratricopeptide repeat protein [Patescibacteria group bacterium]|nr:tetratricopeptide repeat protein [Patescibacteria group bacterium]